jgi:leucyl-tRNA synthetase
VAGCRRFLDRVWRLATEGNKLTDDTTGSADLERALHGAIKKARLGVESLKFNTAISEMMVFVNEATRAERVPRVWFDAFVRVLAPYAPHISEELWRLLGHTESVSAAAFPDYDEAKLKLDTITIAVQVGGKMRGSVEVPAGSDDTTVLEVAKADANVRRHLDGKTIRREIVVKGKLVNFVVG